MAEPGKIEQLETSVKAYLNANVQLLRLETIKHTTTLSAALISKMVLAMVVMMFMLVFSLSAGFYLSTCTGRYDTGFGLLAGFYFILLIVWILLRKRFIEKPIRDAILHKIMDDK